MTNDAGREVVLVLLPLHLGMPAPMTIPSAGWRPPPECPGCDRPIRRQTARSNGGYCTTCRPRGASPVQALDAAALAELSDWQRLAADRGQSERREAAERAARRRRRAR